MSVRSALGALPAWPVLIVVPAVVLAVGAFHYVPTCQTCTRLALARDAFTAAVARAAKVSDPVLRLDQIVRMKDWDQARIIQNPRVEGPLLDCPFGWDLDGSERETLFAQKRLGILAFAKNGEVVDFIEYRSDQVRFDGIDGAVLRASALFDVTVPDSPDGAYLLRPRVSGP